MIYFIKCGEFVKIGCSSDPQQRLEGIRVGNPYELKIIGLIDGGGEEEKRLHAAFEPFHHRYEWFFFSKTIKAFVEKHCIKPERIVEADEKEVFIKPKTLFEAEKSRNTVINWFNEMIVAAPGRSLRAGQVYNLYRDYCKVIDAEPVNLKVFGTMMRHELNIKKRGSGTRISYLDISLSLALVSATPDDGSRKSLA